VVTPPPARPGPDGPGPGGPTDRDRAWRWAAPVAAALFLLVGLLTLSDFARTWDEEESYGAGEQNLRLIAAAWHGRAADVDWPWHEIRGYQFVFDTARAAFARGVLTSGAVGDRLAAFHLANLLLATGSLLLLARLAHRLSGRHRLAGLATLALALTPKFFAHSQSNPKDLIALFVFLLAIDRVVVAGQDPHRRQLIAAGLAMGFAAASHVLAAFLAPLAIAWLLPAWRSSAAQTTWRQCTRRLLGIGAVAAATALLCWPWLWASPLARLAEAARHVSSFQVAMNVLYLGEVYPRTSLPWHYSPVSLLAATPVAMLVLAALGATVLRTGDPPARRLGQLAVLWSAVLLLADQLAAAHYDGVRHLLPILPAAAILIALGAEDLLARAQASGARRLASLAAGLLMAAAAGIGWQLRALHPYPDAYLNEAVNALVEDRTDRLFEVEYWGATYREGAAWLSANAPAGASVLVPIAPELATPLLAPGLTVDGGDNLWRSGADYLLLMVRRGFYSKPLERLTTNRQPVFTIRRQKAVLLEVYAAEATPPTESASSVRARICGAVATAEGPCAERTSGLRPTP
jgi:hypothetical protein